MPWTNAENNNSQSVLLENVFLSKFFFIYLAYKRYKQFLGMLEVRTGANLEDFKLELFNNVALKLREFFSQRRLKGLLIGGATCDKNVALNLDCLLLTDKACYFIDFVESVGKIKLPDYKNFELGVWINEKGDSIRGQRAINPYIQIKIAKEKFLSEVNRKLSFDNSTALTEDDIRLFICFNDSIEIIGKIPDNVKNIFIGDINFTISKIFSIILNDNANKKNTIPLKIYDIVKFLFPFESVPFQIISNHDNSKKNLINNENNHNIKSFDRIKFSENLTSKKDLSFVFISNAPTLELKLEEFRNFATKIFEASNVKIVEIKSFDYQERFIVERDNMTAVCSFYYDKNGNFKKPQYLSGDQELIEAIEKSFIDKTGVSHLNLSCLFKKNTWRKAAYEILSTRLAESNMRIAAIEEFDYLDKLKIFRNNQKLIIDMYYNSSGFFTKAIAIYCDSFKLWEDYKKCVENLKTEIKK